MGERRESGGRKRLTTRTCVPGQGDHIEVGRTPITSYDINNKGEQITLCQRIRHAREYAMPENTLCQRIRHTREYAMPENTLCQRIRYAREYAMPENTPCQRI